MSATDPADALQVGIYELLTGDALLVGLASVYDEVPEDAEHPYVVIGEMTATPDGAHGSRGRSTACVLHTWTRAPSNRPGNAIGARIAALLTGEHMALDAEVAGHTVWRVAHEFSQTLRDPEPGIRHRVDRFRVWTREA